MNTNSGFKLVGRVRLQINGVDGKVRHDTGFMKNKITNASLAVISGLMGATGAQTAFTYLAVGSGSGAESASSTALGTEISANTMGRAAATVSRITTSQTNDTLQLTYTWTASGGPNDVEEIGIFNASSNGVMLGRKLTGTKTINNGESLVATYQVQVTGD